MQSFTLILFEGIKGKPATPLGSRRSLWLMIMLMDTSVMAVRVPGDNDPIIQAEHTCLYFINWVYLFQRRKATVTVRALEAVWNLSPALVSLQLSWFLQLVLSIQPFIQIKQVLDFLFLSVPALWEHITPAHTTRRLPKPASTLTISSDDLDDRDGPSESGWLLYFKGSARRLFSKLSWKWDILHVFPR